jgi:hypothetical protein
MRIVHSLRTSVAFCLVGIAMAPSVARAQTDTAVVDRLRRDQDEILRKAERLQALMQRLQERYQREGKTEQVELLSQGLQHLERSGVLRDVASIRDDIAATALTEALRKQKEVVEDLERLLNILLERRSIEQIDDQLRVTSEQAASARELEQRQRDLIESTRQALSSKLSPGEQQLITELETLQAAERREADRNAVQAGARRPFLESALERVRRLLDRQQRLETSTDAETEGRSGEIRAREFDLGELTQRTRELAGSLRDQSQQKALGEASQAVQTAAEGSDQQALQQARELLEALLREAPRTPGAEGPVRDPKWRELRQQMEAAPAGATPTEREELKRLAEAGSAISRERTAETGQANARASERLKDDAGALAERMKAGTGAPPAEDSPAKSVESASRQLAEAATAVREGDVAKARQHVDQALSALEKARAQHDRDFPDAAQQAAQMAAEARAAAQELRNAPSAEGAEQQASEELRQASESLRATEQALEQARDAGRRPDVGTATSESRTHLEQAQQTLEEALAKANAGGAEDLQAAAQRQRDLEQQAEKTAQRLQQAAKAGDITPSQAQKAGEQMARATQQMQQAAERLQAGEQAGAAASQQQAADTLQRAAEELQKNRAVTEQQQQELARQAAQQQKLAEDIMRLAEELKNRENKAAQRAAQRAADAAQRAQRAMERGDAEETQEQQEEARQQLQQAAEQLEEEEDRYQDLRQEELLFRMKDELTAFLDRQRPITQQTIEAQKAATDGLSRPVRRKLNQLGEEEQELAGRLEFLVNALTDDGNLVYQTVLQANLEDLREVATRLAGRIPDPGSYTTMLQQDVERRTEEMLKALERERQRREQQRREQQQQQQQSQNRFSQQREKLVSLIAELELLKQLEADTQRATNNLRTLVEARGDETVSEAEVALIERLAHRHGEVTKLFTTIKQGVEQAMQQMDEEGDGEQGGGGR